MWQRLKAIKGARSTGVYLLSNLVSAAVPFLLLPFLVRLISPSEYGQVALFTGIFQVGLAFVGMNTIGAVKRRYFNQGEHDDPDDYARYIGVNLIILFATTLLTLAVVAVLSGWLGGLTGFAFPILAMAVLVAFGKYVTDLRLGDYQVRKQAVNYGVLQVALALANGGLSLAIVYYLMRSAEGRIVGMAVAFGLFALVALVSLMRAGLVKIDFSRERFRDSLAFGVPLVPHVLGMFLLTLVDRFFVAEYSGLAMAGIYAAATQLVFVLRVLTDSINKSFQPWVFERLAQPEETHRQVAVASYRLFLVTILAGVAFAVVSPLLVTLMLGEAYRAAIALMPLLVLGTIFHGIYIYLMNFLLYVGKTGHLSYITIVIGLINVGLLYVLVPPYGAMGAAIALAAGALLRLIAVHTLVIRHTQLSWRVPSISSLLGRE